MKNEKIENAILTIENEVARTLGLEHPETIHIFAITEELRKKINAVSPKPITFEELCELSDEEAEKLIDEMSDEEAIRLIKEGFAYNPIVAFATALEVMTEMN